MTHKKILRSSTALAAATFAITAAMAMSTATRADDAKPADAVHAEAVKAVVVTQHVLQAGG